MRDKLESLGVDGIENIAEIDPAGVLELLDSNLVDRDKTGSGVVTVDDEFPRVRWIAFYFRSCKRRRLVVEASGRFVMWILA